MSKLRILVSIVVISAAVSPMVAAQHGMPGGIPMSFFVTSEPVGNGGDLGGLEGADAHCQRLATDVGAGEFSWRAYLSTQTRPGKPAINARDRIGEGPWHNYDGVMIASSIAHLHGDTLELARMGNNLHKQSGLTEKGAIVPGLYDFLDPRDTDWEYVKTTPYSNRHEVITGSQPDGMAYPPEIDYTCDSWTSNADPGPEIDLSGLSGGTNRPNAQIGFPDREGGGNGSWNSSHGTRGCSQAALPITHGIGQFYCFAVGGENP